MCTVSGLIAGVARARLPYAENPVSGDLLGAREDVCARAVPACGVRKCGMGVRRESGQRHGCGEAVPGAAGGRRPLVGSPWQWCAHVREVCWWACGGGGTLCLPAVLGRACPPRTLLCVPASYVLALSKHFKFYLRVVRGSNSAQKSLYNFTISEPFRNNSLPPKNLLRGADFFGLYQTLL